MFKLLGEAGGQVEIELDGETVSVPEGVSIAAALLYLDRLPLRHSAVGGAGRAPFCMMGICFECLVEVDGLRDQRACQLEVRPGMRLRRQLRTPAESDT